MAMTTRKNNTNTNDQEGRMHRIRIGWAHTPEYLADFANAYNAWRQKPARWTILPGETNDELGYEATAIMLVTPRKPGLEREMRTKAFFDGWNAGRGS